MSEIFELCRKHRCSIEIRYIEEDLCLLIRIEKKKYALSRRISLENAIYWPENTTLFSSIVHEMIRDVEEVVEETEGES